MLLKDSSVHIFIHPNLDRRHFLLKNISSDLHLAVNCRHVIHLRHLKDMFANFYHKSLPILYLIVNIVNIVISKLKFVHHADKDDSIKQVGLSPSHSPNNITRVLSCFSLYTLNFHILICRAPDLYPLDRLRCFIEG